MINFNFLSQLAKTAVAILLSTALFLVSTLSFAQSAIATEIPAQGSQEATVQLPKPDPVFKGRVGKTYKDSVPSYPKPVKAPEGDPNVLLILLDDVGFGMTSTFGGPVPTPNLDKLANNGISYNRFHTTALCSPTRAALLSGRNHHSVGTGVIIETGTGYPGYTGIIPKSTALISEILNDNGYATAMFGKWHNTPEPDISPAGPFNRWPTGLGFDYFYGFNGGEAHQYYPNLYRNTVPLSPPKTPEEGYHLTADMTDEAIAWTRNVRAADKEFHNVIDIAPTILEATKIPAPTEVNGIDQKPIEGVSMLYSFDDQNAQDQRTTQYFEMFVNRGIYDEGWMASSHFGVPWNTASREGDFLDAPWELYNLEEDFSQANDLAQENPEKLQDLQAKFVEEAQKYNVFPLDPRLSEGCDTASAV
ncbi:MAG: sulfatase-like hydrolase/transferase [Halothece sp.]